MTIIKKYSTSDERSKIRSITAAITIWLRTEQFTLCHGTDVLTKLPIITLDTQGVIDILEEARSQNDINRRSK